MAGLIFFIYIRKETMKLEIAVEITAFLVIQ